MRRCGYVLFIVSSLLAPALYGQTRYDLDIQQAKLNDKSKALDDVSRSFGQFVVIRDQVLNGTDGFYPQSKQWFVDAAAWMNAWSPILRVLEGQRLGNQDEANKATAVLSQQLTGLKDLLARQSQILAKGQVAVDQLKAVQRVRPARLDNFAESGDSFNTQIDRVQSESITSLGIFSSNLDESLQDLAKQLDDLLKLKIQKLALTYPELVNILKEIELTMTSIKLVDVEIARIVGQDLKIQQAFNKGRVYYAMAQFEELKKDIGTVRASLQNQSLLTDGAKNNGFTRLDAILASRERDIQNSLGLLTQKQRFVSYYRNEVLSPVTGMVRKCRAGVLPKNIDCALLKSIVFTEAHVQGMNEGQQAYLEKTLDRVKEGPISSVDSLQGAKK